MELITVHASISSPDADLVFSRLDAAEFHPVLTHGNSPLSVFPYSGATGGILVQVPENEAEEAIAFLADSKTASDDDTPQA
jgi:hypothetical protein